MGLIVIFITGVCTSIVLNLLVVIVLARKKKKINYMDVIIISLSICDLFKDLVGYSLEIDSSIRHRADSKQECIIVGFSITFLGLVSISHMVGISLQRCIILLFPMRARIWSMRLSTAWYVVVPSWLYGFFWALPPLLGWSTYRPFYQGSHLCGPDLGHAKTFETSDVPKASKESFPFATTKQPLVSGPTGNQAASYLLNLFVFCFAIPVVIIGICSYIIHSTLKNMRTNGEMLGLTSAIVLQRQQRERKQCIMDSVMIGAFILAWSPFSICVFVLALGKTVSPLLVQIAAMMGKSSSLFNPIIYSLFLRHFRTSCKKLLPVEQFRTLKAATSSAYRRLSDNFHDLYHVLRVSKNLEVCAEDSSSEAFIAITIQKNTFNRLECRSRFSVRVEYSASLNNSKGLPYAFSPSLKLQKFDVQQIGYAYERSKSCPA